MIRTEKGYGQIFKIYGVSETEVKDALKEILNQGSAVPVCTRRRGKEVHVLAETAETDEERAKELLRPVSRSIKKALGDMYYTTRENETMEEAVVRLLVKNKLTVTTVESCTGGMIHRRSSTWLEPPRSLTRALSPTPIRPSGKWWEWGKIR